MKGKHNYKTVCKWLLIAIVLIVVEILLQSGPGRYKSIDRYTTADVVYSDGSTAHFDDKNFGIVNKDDVVSIHIKLPVQPFFEKSTLTFYDYNAVTEVWCNGTLMDSYGEEISEKGRMIGNHSFMIAIPDEAWGNEITVVLRATEDLALTNFIDMQIYPAERAYQFYTDSDPIWFVIAISLFLCSIIGFLSLILSKIRGLDLCRGLAVTVTALLASFWMIANKGIYNIFGFDGYFWQPLEYLAGYAVPVPMLLFFGSMTKDKARWKKRFDILTVIAGVFWVAATVLNFTNIVHFDVLMAVFGIILILSALLILVSVTSRKSDNYIFSTSLSVCMHIFAAICIYEVALRSLSRFTPLAFLGDLPSFAPLGVASAIFCMAMVYLPDLFGKHKDLVFAQVKADTLSEVIDATPAGICQLIPGEQGVAIYANDIFYKIMGYTDEDLNGRKPDSALAHLKDEEKEFIRSKLNEIQQSSENHGECEFYVTDESQNRRTILARYSCDRSNDCITAIFIDISERKHIEDELRIHSEEYRLAIEASDHLYFNYDAVTKTCTYMFDAAEMFGISEKIQGLPESLISLGLCAPESVDDLRRAFHMFHKGVPKGDFVIHLQNVKTHVYRWYGGSYRTVFDSNGTPYHAVVAFKDVTEQREKEIAYSIHRQQIESHSEDEISYFELNLTTGFCTYSYGAAAKQICAVTSDWKQMLSYALLEFVRSEDREDFNDFLTTEHLLKLFRRGITEASHEFRGYVSGSLRWLHASVSMTADERTHEVRAYCAVEDIEEEKIRELEQQEERQRSEYYENAYEKLASSVMYGVCKYSADDDLSIVFANDVFYQMHGYPSQAAAVAAGFTSVLFATPPFGKEIVRAAHREYAEGKAGQLFETEYPITDIDGKRIWILCRGVYSREEKLFNASVLNITDRKNTEEQLKISEERYRLALSQSGKVFFFFDVPTRTMHLSDELAKAFGLPNKVDNMPENFIAQGLVEAQSVEKYCHFYEEIYAGKPSGSAIISCHMKDTPDEVLWYRIAFTSVFDAKGVPQSAVITYDDLQEERANKISGAWKQLNIISVPETKYAIIEHNLTQNRMLSQTGKLFSRTPDFLKSYDETNAFVLEHFIFEDDVAEYRRFLDRERVLKMFEDGKTEDTIEYRSTQSSSSPRWTSTSIQMIQDPYSGDVLAQMLIMDIHTEKSGQIEMAQNFEELKKELENSRIKVMINQMQPHFLYNALSAIQTIVKVDPDYAYRLIYDFTVHLRSSIKALSSDAPISFADELANIKAYLNIEQMRFGDSLKVKYEIDCESFSVIPLSIQPLAENAARHGVYPKGNEGGTVTVRTYETPCSYVVEVEDDGVGFNFNEVLEKSGDSIGLKSLIFRLKSLMNADVTINSQLGVGTLVTVTIPKEEAKS